MRSVRKERTALAVALALLAASLAVVAGPTPQASADDLVETWVPRKSVEVPVRTLPAMAYDRGGEEVVMFGGYGPAGNNPQRRDTWVWDGVAWTERQPSTSPGFCPAPEMAHDAARGNTVLFCGYGAAPGSPGATWTWNGAMWTQRSTPTAPGPRQHYVFAYDEARGEVVLFGGRSNSGSYLSDMWVWNGTSWAQRATSTAPPARSGAAATYDVLRSELVVFSGTGNGGVLTDTWVWNGATWTQRSPASSPGPRWTATMAYDSGRAASVLFGGVDVRTNTYRQDTWTWNGSTWSEVTTVASPPARYFAGMAFDEKRSQTVLHAGAVANAAGGAAEGNDTWTLDTSPNDCGELAVPETEVPLLPPVEEPIAVREPDPCCAEPPTDAEGNVILPPDATDIEEVDVSEDRGYTSDLYPHLDTTTENWYDQVECPWSIGGEVPPMDPYLDLDQQLRDAGFTSSAAELIDAIDRQNDEVLLQVQRPTPPEMLVDAGPIAGWCPKRGPVTLPVGLPLTPPVDDPIGLIPEDPTGSPQCTDGRRLSNDLPFRGRDVIFVHGLDMGALKKALKGEAGYDTKWPQDKSEFIDETGVWKLEAKDYWDDHIKKYLGHDLGNPSSAPPTNRYLITSWASTQWMAFGAHAVLSQIAGAMATGEGVIEDASGSDDGFCDQGCVIINHSTGGPVTDIAMAVAEYTNIWPFSTLGDLRWVPERIDTVVAFAPAFGGSHYATVVAALGWAVALTAPMCQLNQWIWSNVFAWPVPCSRLTIIAQSVLTDLAVPVMQELWRPIIGLTPVPVLIVSTAHPTASGLDSAALKAVSPIVKMLFHHGLDDGVVSMDSQCAAKGDWKTAPQSYTAKPTIVDAALNGALLSQGLPAVIAARAFDTGNPDRAIQLYVDQVVGAQIATPEFWKAVKTTPTLLAHFGKSPYRIASTCDPDLSPTGMVQPVMRDTHPGTSPQRRLDNHYSFLMAASDHYTAATGPFDTVCYEVTSGTGRDCNNHPNNREEVRVIDDDDVVHFRHLVSAAINDEVKEEVKGRAVKFKWRKKPFKWWKWKRTYHRLEGWETHVAADYVYEYVLR